MDIKSQLLVEHSKKNTELIRDFVGEDPNRIAALLHCFFSQELKVSQRAAMVVSAVFDNTPAALVPYTTQLIDNLINNTQHVAIKRCTIRILQSVQIPEDRMSIVFDLCLQSIIDVKEPIAIKAFSMSVVLNICKNHPELKHEVIPILTLELERNESAGVLNRGRKVLKTLQKLD